MMLRWNISKFVVLTLGLFVLFAGSAFAATSTYNWTTSGGGNGTLGTSSTQVTGLTSFTAASILGFTGGGRAAAVAGAGSINLTISITQDGTTWIPVWTGSVTAPAGLINLSTIGPITFGGGTTYTVTGLRFDSVLPGGSTALGGWDNLNGTSPGGGGIQTTFTLDTHANPEPATLLLVGAGLGGLVWHRRRRRVTVSS